MINSTIGKYKITRLIGEGGMASVYEAEHEMLGTKVAIKVLNPILSANAQVRERFINEAKLMASLDHPNITKVIDFDEQTQQLSIIMEYLDGEDLNEKIKRNGALSETEIVDLLSQTLPAFQYAHEKGIVHRDIKPSNIFILPNGHIKILDFGIAKLFGQGNEMTQTGTQIGTPIYMSPEQVKADKSIDHRSDIYSLGVSLFYAINGKPPYDSETDSQFDIFTKIVFEPLAEMDNNSFLNDFVKKACQKDRILRYQSCKEWEFALNNIVESKNSSANKTIINVSKESIEKTQFESPILINNNEKNDDFKLKNSTNSQTNKNSSVLIYSIFGLLAVVLIVSGIAFFVQGRDKENLNSHILKNGFIETENDWTKENIQGKVLSYSELIYEAVELSGNPEKGKLLQKNNLIFNYSGNFIEGKRYDSSKSLLDRWTKKYDEKENLIECNLYHSDGTLSAKETNKFDGNNNLIEKITSGTDLSNKITYKNDKKGNPIEIKTFSSSGILISTDSYKYDKQGNLIESIGYTADGSFIEKTTYNYDENANLIERNSFESDEKLSSKQTYKYDGKGNVIEVSFYNSETSVESISIMKYEFDTKGNWIKVLQYDNDKLVYIHERTYEYFD